MNNYNSFTCSEDIKRYLELCKSSQEKIFKELDSMPNGFLNFTNAELRTRKKELKSRLKQLRVNMSASQDLFEKYTTFDSDIFLPFLVSYLSLKENEQYALIEDIEEDNFALAIATDTYPFNLFGECYNVITTVSNEEKINKQESFGMCFGDTDDIDDFLSVCEDKKYICLQSYDEYTLLDGINLDSDFNKYPYLLDLAYELVDLKLSNPDLGDKDRLNAMLSKAQTYRKKKY